MNLLIPYVRLPEHEDPLFSEFTYGDSKSRGRKLLKKVKKGDVLVFHTTKRGRKLITAYYVVDRVLRTEDAQKNRMIMTKFRNPHLSRKGPGEHDAVLFGDPIESSILDKPLPFDRDIARKLTLEIRFPEGQSDTQSIAYATRSWRELSNGAISALMKEIDARKGRGISKTSMLTTDEVAEVNEQDLENIMKEDNSCLGGGLTLAGTQYDTEVGRIDMLFKDKRGDYTVVELKTGKIGRGAVSQIRRYMSWLRKATGRNVNGMIVCEDVLPTFAEEYSKGLRDIRILRYGWRLSIDRWARP